MSLVRMRWERQTNNPRSKSRVNKGYNKFIIMDYLPEFKSSIFDMDVPNQSKIEKKID